MTDPTTRELIADLLATIKSLAPNGGGLLINKAEAFLAQSEPSLTVEDCSNLPKHAGNYIAEDFGQITLDGHFTREDLIEIANTAPLAEDK